MKKRKGPTPKKKPPKLRWRAKCENCGFIDVIRPEPIRGPTPLWDENYSPCPSCGNVTAVYVEVAA